MARARQIGPFIYRIGGERRTRLVIQTNAQGKWAKTAGLMTKSAAEAFVAHMNANTTDGTRWHSIARPRHRLEDLL